ncbi:MAG: zinc ribbon domain-containing protein [Dehalococcoidia bacterium]|nr:zinc ribbon domain-containing protein [Dehalococcoidia bacterium]
MPVYEFRCRKCGKEFEVRRLFSESEKPAACPACRGPGEKLISGYAFKMGFYTRPTENPLRGEGSTWSGRAVAGAAKGKAPVKPAKSAPGKSPRPAAKAKRRK